MEGIQSALLGSIRGAGSLSNNLLSATYGLTPSSSSGIGSVLAAANQTGQLPDLNVENAVGDSVSLQTFVAASQQLSGDFGLLASLNGSSAYTNSINVLEALYSQQASQIDQYL